jgi:hypothetical protein
VAGGVGLIMVIGVATMCSGNNDDDSNSSDDSPNQTVVKWVKRDNPRAPWMKHVKHWDTGSGITVETDYSPDRPASWAAAYEICKAVKRAYAKGANELPKVTVNGARTHLWIRVDGSKHRDIDTEQLAISAKRHGFVCGITPPEDDRRARKLGVPVYPY